MFILGENRFAMDPNFVKAVETEDDVVGFLKKLVIIHGIVFVLCFCETAKNMYPSEQSV